MPQQLFRAAIVGTGRIGSTYDGQDCATRAPAGIRCPHEVGPMSSHVELCEHHAKNCLQAAEKAEDPLAREMLLRHALEWMRDGLDASKQSKLCAVCGRKAGPGSSLVH